jgi:alpha-beta hydrolase superfamily lysophospholipase
MGQALRARRAAFAVIAASLLLAAAVGAAAAQSPTESGWMPDTLLAGFEAKMFTFENDYDGPVTATLVRRPHATRQACAVLYVHGYVDYFFQPWLADFFETGLQDGGTGCDFFALDLRKHGRSLPPNYKRPNFAKDLEEYFPEITASLDVIKREGYAWVLLNAHSTGALVAARYLQDGRDRSAVQALVLNSPFLDFNELLVNGFRIALTKVFGAVCPMCYSGSPVSRWYARSLHNERPDCTDCHGRWDFDLSLKPLDGFKVHFGWVRAIAVAQERAREGGISQPILVLHSDQSLEGRSKDWKEEYRAADLVLNVEDMKRDGPKLGDTVTVREVPGGVHDLVLSDDGAQSRYFAEVASWLRSLPGGPLTPIR